ncbi:unnamed protein product [Calypogeia fissa]
MNPKAVLAMLFMIAPTIYGCVNFQANKDSDGTLHAKLWDNGSKGDQPTCWVDGGIDSSDNQFHFVCFQGDYAAWFVPASNGDDDVVKYVRPGLNNIPFQFAVKNEGDHWQSCQYGCNQGEPACFVPE